MDEYRIKITSQAREQLREIRRYIEKVLLSPTTAANTLAVIKKEMQALPIMPAGIHLTPEQPWHDQGIRRDRVKNYYIYFWIDEEKKIVQIIAVIYSRRDQFRQLEQMDTQ